MKFSQKKRKHLGMFFSGTVSHYNYISISFHSNFRRKHWPPRKGAPPQKKAKANGQPRDVLHTPVHYANDRKCVRALCHVLLHSEEVRPFSSTMKGGGGWKGEAPGSLAEARRRRRSTRVQRCGGAWVRSASALIGARRSGTRAEVGVREDESLLGGGLERE